MYSRDAEGAIKFDEPPIVGEISADPDFAGVRLIAEPWDAGAYQLGRGFPGLTWLQWNGAFRDDVRRFVRGDPGMVSARSSSGCTEATISSRMIGSTRTAVAERELRHLSRRLHAVRPRLVQPQAKLGKRTRKHRRSAENFSWNCGWEGDERVPDEVLALR